MHARSTLLHARQQTGFGLVEIMVGIVIGLLALLIIYRGLALSEGYRRTTTAGGDAQSAGMISTFILAQDISNAGNTIADTAPDLMNCPVGADFTSSWRPIPVLITDGGADDVSDQISIFHGASRRLVTQVDTRVTPAAPATPLQVQSPLAWAVDHMFVITQQVGPICEVARVTNVAGPDAAGVVTLSHGPVPGIAVSGITQIFPQPSWMVNLGPANLVRKVTYAVAGDTVTVDNLLDAAPPTPITSSVVLLKAQYGIDTSNPMDGTIDVWTSARNAPWRPADVLAAPLLDLPPGALNGLRRIKAVRIAMVVRSSQFERAKDAEGLDACAVPPCAANEGFTNRTLFPCNGLPGCTGEMPAVTIAGTQNYRYRIFEQVIPLRNQIWNPS
jgi:type IV pilus assembly protein PilW